MGNSYSKQLLSLIDQLLTYLFCSVLLIDMITGYFLNIDIHIPLSQIFKFFLLGLLMFRLSFHENSFRKVFYYTLYSIGLVAYFLIISSFWSDKIILFSKFLMTIFVFFYFKELIEKKPESSLKIVNKILLSNSAVLIFNIFILGLLGIGLPQYVNAEGMGSKGFFYAGNEISIVWILLFSYALFSMHYNNYKYKSIVTIALLIIGFYSGTKTIIAGSIILALIIPRTIGRKESVPFSKKMGKFLIGIMLGVALIIVFVYIAMKSGLWERWTWFYEQDIVYFLFSGRISFVENQMTDFSQSPFIYKLLGLPENRTVEMDFFDVVLNYGYIGLIVVYSFYFSAIRIFIKKMHNQKIYIYAKFALIVTVMILCISLFAGHTIFSAMASSFIGIIMALSVYKKQIDE